MLSTSSISSCTGTWLWILLQPERAPGTLAPTGLRITHLCTIFATFLTARAPARFHIKLDTFCALGSNCITWTTYALAFYGIPAVVAWTRHKTPYAIASAVFFRVALGSIITIRRFNFTLTRTTRVIRHADWGNFIWGLVQSVWWWRPRSLAHKKVEVFFFCVAKKNIYVTRFSNECRKTQTETEVTEQVSIECRKKAATALVLHRPIICKYFSNIIQALQEVVCSHFEF